MNHADWRTTTDAGEFLAQAGPYLDADPVENTLLLTIAHGALGSSPHPHPVKPFPCTAGTRKPQPCEPATPPARRPLTAPSFTPPACRSSSAR